MERNVILAKNAGFCFGVKRAVDEAIKYQKEFGKIEDTKSLWEKA